jgi:hypothetical protein
MVDNLISIIPYQRMKGVMMGTPTFIEVLSLARSLSPEEQHDLIEALSEPESVPHLQNSETQIPNLPSSIHRGLPVQDIHSLVAPFWPLEESADKIIDFIHKQREEDKYL